MAKSTSRLCPQNWSFYSVISIVVLSQFCSHLLASHSIVNFLPGFDGPLPFVLETGYIGVEEEEVQLFYYFVESENNPKEDPLVFWFIGGPACSAISGLLYEMGPMQFEQQMYNGNLPRLLLNPYSWTKVASIVFVDLPNDTGFSYSTTGHDSYTGDYRASCQANEFVRKWLADHPKFLSSSVYLGGESYTGKTLPLYFIDMVRGNEEGVEPFVHLEGYLLGNPVTDATLDYSFRIPYSHGMGLISDELYESLQRSCGGIYFDVDPKNVECLANIEAYNECVSGIFDQMILEPSCDSRRSRELLLDLNVQAGFRCRQEEFELARYWLNDVSVQEALHVRKGSIGEWIRCNRGLNYSYDVKSSVPYHANLSTKGYRSLIYSGDHDLRVPFLGTQEWVRSLNYWIVDDWRPWIVDGQVGGYTRTYANRMTFATVKGGGHTAPEYRPKESEAMFKRWISGQPL